MTNQPIHILNQMGVITSFSVAKKITENDIHKFFNRRKRSGKSKAELEKMLREKLTHEIHEAIVKQEIPGLLTSQDLAKAAGMNTEIVDNIPELNRLIMVIAHKLSKKKYDKMSLCYLVNGLVNVLGLQETDFEKFHLQNNKDDGDDDGEDNGDDDGYKDKDA